MKDFNASKESASLRQRWVFDDRFSRTGSPYVWICGENMVNMLEEQYTVLQALSMYYEEYPTLPVLRIPDYEAALKKTEDYLESLVRYYFPFLEIGSEVRNNIKCTSLTRTQDYCFIKKFCVELPKSPTHLDIGPGLGSHSIYSQFFLGGKYFGLEAASWSFSAQRHFYRYLATVTNGTYFDPVVAEHLQLPLDKIRTEINSRKYSIVHLPSWYSEELASSSVDLVTATWVLNEVAPAGIVWLLAQATRALKQGGYFYVRDSALLKPGRHSTNYDNVLVDLGFEKVNRLDVKNRVDMFGIPRAYRKKKEVNFTFEQLYDRLYGKFAITAQPGELMQNITKDKS